MKNKVFGVVAVLLMVGMFFLATGYSTVQAQSTVGTVPGVPGISDGSWVVNSATHLTSTIPMYKVTPLMSWLKLMSSGAVISGPAKICYPFRGGQFGWVGQIRMLVNGAWVPIPSTQTWVPTTEGKLMICADAPSAGTYAVFAYWKP